MKCLFYNNIRIIEQIEVMSKNSPSIYHEHKLCTYLSFTCQIFLIISFSIKVSFLNSLIDKIIFAQVQHLAIKQTSCWYENY